VIDFEINFAGLWRAAKSTAPMYSCGFRRRDIPVSLPPVGGGADGQLQLRELQQMVSKISLRYY